MRKLLIIEMMGGRCDECVTSPEYLPRSDDWAEVSEEEYKMVQKYVDAQQRDWHNPKHFILLSYYPAEDDGSLSKNIMDEIRKFAKEEEERARKKKATTEKAKLTKAKKKEEKDKKLWAQLQAKYEDKRP